MNDNKIDYYKCSCHGEGIMLQYYFNEPTVDLSFWQLGFDDKRLSWKNKVRYIWQVLTTGLPYNDMVILTKKEAGRLGNDLLLFSITPIKDNK